MHACVCVWWLDGGEGSGIVYQRSLSMPSSPLTPGTPTSMSPTAGKKDNVWRSVFNPGSNSATKNVGADYFDKPQPNSPTVYDWYNHHNHACYFLMNIVIICFDLIAGFIVGILGASIVERNGWPWFWSSFFVNKDTYKLGGICRFLRFLFIFFLFFDLKIIL